jgi:hypothetical protein
MAVFVAVSYATTRMPKGRSTSQTRHATGWLCSRLTPTLRLANKTLRRCRLQHICEHSGQVLVPVELAYPPQLARNSSCIDHHHWSRSREGSLAFYRRDVVCYHNAIQRPTSRSSKLVSRTSRVKGDLISNPQTLAGVRAANCARASRCGEFSTFLLMLRTKDFVLRQCKDDDSTSSVVIVSRNEFFSRLQAWGVHCHSCVKTEFAYC